MQNKDFKVDFIGIGVMKAASSWIFKCLMEHPEICGSSKKELHFFDRPDNYKKEIDYYKSFFNNCSHNKVKGEYTPSYIFFKEVPKLIYKHFPEVKLILCLRNPIERAYSHYLHALSKSEKWSFKTFEEALGQRPEFLERGFYYQQLKKYFNLFPKENILVLIYEDIAKDPLRFVQNIYNFLEVNPNFVPQVAFQKSNTSILRFGPGFKLVKKVYPRLTQSPLGKFTISILKTLKIKKYIQHFDLSYTKIRKPKPMTTITRKKLQKIYQKDIKKLEKLINKDLSFWK